jgi:hypothetical protein
MNKITLEQLTAGIKERNVDVERAKLVEKWNKTGLLKGLDAHKRTTLAQLFENQAAQILKESASLSTGGGAVTSSGQIQGFSNIAFPIIRRVFGGLVANELVSIQPMSLPSGLIFYLDYTYGTNVGGEAAAIPTSSPASETYMRGQSLYNNPAGKGVQSGSLATGGMYDLVNTGYTKVHSGTLTLSGSGLNLGAWTGAAEAWTAGGIVASSTDFSGTNARMLGYDPQVESDVAANNLDVTFVHFAVSDISSKITKGDFSAVDQIALFGFATTNGALEWGESYQSGKGILNLRRLNKRGNWTGSVFTPAPLDGTHIQLVIRLSNGGSVPVMGSATQKMSMAIADALSVDSTSGATLTIPSFETDFGSTPSPAIPEVDIKIESIPITAVTRKLRARWSPELAQDLNAYHQLDAEVELTSILSQQIALEIDKEILQDLVTQANGANYYWSRAPGKFLNKVTGQVQHLANSLSIGPAFTGTIREWYEGLVETCVDVANTIQRKTLRGSANFLVCGPDVATIFEQSTLWKSKFTVDGDGQVSAPFTIGCESIGSVSNRFTVYKDAAFPRNKILVGYKGGSPLETGYVYAPYVPLIVTPTLYNPEDFVPRKGVMTRYGKKMVRSDFFGTVTVTDMNII